MVWIAAVIHPMFSNMDRKVTSLSFVALERSSAADPTGNKDKIGTDADAEWAYQGFHR